MATPITITGLGQGSATGQSLGRGFRVPASRPATLTTAGPANSNLTFTSKLAGTAGNAITVRYLVAGASTPLTVGVAGNAITVNVATSAGSAATSTGAQVRDAIRASGPASALVSVALASGNDGTAVVGAFAATNLAGGVDAGTTERGETLIVPGLLYQVDLDNNSVRKKLAREPQLWTELPSGSLTRFSIRSLLIPSSGDVTQSFVSRGFRVQTTGSLPGAAGTSTTSQDLSTLQGAIEVDLTNAGVRRALRQNFGKWTPAAPPAVGSTLITIRGLVTSGSAPGGGISGGRGFRIAKYGQTSASTNVTSTTNVQVDLADWNVRRTLRRNIGRWVVVSAP